MLDSKQLAKLRRSEAPKRNRIAKAIELAGVTQTQLADAIGSTQSHISAIAGGHFGKSGLPVETARNIASFFGCSIEDIFPACERESALAS